MSAPSSCLENVIGLSRTDCECLEDRPVDSGVSLSGLYLDELPGLNLRMLDASKKCGQGTLWDMLERARETAIEETIEAVMAGVAANTDPRRQDGTGEIGSGKKATAMSHKLLHPLHGMTVQTSKVRGGTLEVIAIGTAFKPDNLPATITVNVYQREELSSDPVATYVLPCTPNKIVWTDLPTSLVLSLDFMPENDPRYWFLYEPVAGMKAMNSLINCNCGGFKPYWDTNSPPYNGVDDRPGQQWSHWCMGIGTRGSSLDNRDEWTVDNVTDGLMLRVRFKCDSMSTFCPSEPDYKTDDIQRVLAHTVRFKAGANLVRDLQSTVEPTVYTMTAGEQMTDNRRRYEKEWRDRVEGYLVPELSNVHNINRYGDCRKCRDTWGMRRSKIPN